MGRFMSTPQDVLAWRVEDLLELSTRPNAREHLPSIIYEMWVEKRVNFIAEREVITIEIRGEMFEAPKDYWIVYNHGFFEAVTEMYFHNNFESHEASAERMWNEAGDSIALMGGNSSYGQEAIENRFGFHRATVEGPEATAPVHKNIRKNFIAFATWLDSVVPNANRDDKREIFKNLHFASMLSHWALAEQQPLMKE